MYVVAAASQRQSLPLPSPGPNRRVVPLMQPVGVRHAVSSAFIRSVRPAALCGARIHDWLVFPEVMFDPRHAAACQRCAQLISAASSDARRWEADIGRRLLL
jgi:hypothetical protein